jgi:tellurium resistance protein TerZ
MALSLSKGQTVSLQKQAPDLSLIYVGLGWNPAAATGGFLGKLFGGAKKSIDLDASCLLFDSQNRLIDMVYFGQLTSRDGSVRHSGDNLTGEGDGDDESILINLPNLSAEVQSIVVTVNSYRGQTFDQVGDAFVRLVNQATSQEVLRFGLNEKGTNTGVIMGVLSRKTGEWSFQAIGAPVTGRTGHDLAGFAVNYL